MSDTTSQLIRASLEEIQQGDEKARDRALDELIQVAYDRLSYLAHRLLRFKFPRLALAGVETVGIVSEVYRRLKRAFTEPTVRDRLKTSLDFFRLAQHHLRWELLELARQQKREPKMLALAGDGASNSAIDIELSGMGPDKEAQLAELFAAIDRLPEEQRQAVELVWIGGRSRVDAAEILGTTEATIRRRLRAGEETLIDFYKGELPF